MLLNAPEILAGSILIVDDQQVNVQLLERLLSGAGYTSVSSTTNPEEVCELHRKNNYDLILLDLQMPIKDGFQVMEELKEVEADGYLPVLVITAQPDHKLNALKAGAKDFVSKPFDVVEVQTRIHNMLEVRLLYKKIENANKILEQRVLERTAALQESETRFRRLTELSSDWYWEQDESGHFTKVYGPVLEMLGMRADQLLGATWDYPGTHWNKEEHQALQDNMSARRPFLDFIYSRIAENGVHQFLMVSGEPMFDVSGRFIGYRGVGKDVSESMRKGAH